MNEPYNVDDYKDQKHHRPTHSGAATLRLWLPLLVVDFVQVRLLFELVVPLVARQGDVFHTGHLRRRFVRAG